MNYFLINHYPAAFDGLFSPQMPLAISVFLLYSKWIGQRYSQCPFVNKSLRNVLIKSGHLWMTKSAADTGRRTKTHEETRKKNPIPSLKSGTMVEMAGPWLTKGEFTTAEARRHSFWLPIMFVPWRCWDLIFLHAVLFQSPSIHSHISPLSLNTCLIYPMHSLLTMNRET